jgi:drug/metabolite transporter (DMT)-like permease
MIQAFGLLFVGICFSVIGELLLKHGVNNLGGTLELWPFPDLIGSLVRVFTNLYVLIGFVLLFAGSIFWLSVLSRLELSLAYPMLSLSYVVVVLLSWVIFRENVTPLRLLGVFVIVGGVALVGLSNSQAGDKDQTQVQKITEVAGHPER